MPPANSTMPALGTAAPDFSLPATNGMTVRLDDFAPCDALLVMFICNHCPFVVHIREELVNIASDYAGRNVGIVAINSNDVKKYPDDSPAKMAEEVKAHGYTFPYLFDETQEVAKAYGAACTPDFFLYDGEHRLAYRGQLDDSRPNSSDPVTGKDLRAALDAVLSGQDVPEPHAPSIGCSIKWVPGNEPVYA
ncbi:MAG: thioredoxin family protein [Planctomycetota bacterium]